MVSEGRYKDRSEAIRAALTLLKRTMEAQRQGYVVVSIDPAELKKRGIPVAWHEP